MISRFPILIGSIAAAFENLASQSAGNFSIVPPKRERIFSKLHWLLPAISAIALLRSGLEIMASRWPPISHNGASLAASQTALARFRQTNINPPPKKLFLVRAFCLFLLRHFLR